MARAEQYPDRAGWAVATECPDWPTVSVDRGERGRWRVTLHGRDGATVAGDDFGDVERALTDAKTALKAAERAVLGPRLPLRRENR